MRTKSNDASQQQHGLGDSSEPGLDPGIGDGDEARAMKRKRKPSKPKDKKYECPHEGCGKSYSRAEHLYRHQLNHAPKQIYRCDFEGCDRHFVRQDLCTRHRERHTKENSHLYRKDAFKHNNLGNHSPATSSEPSEITKRPAVGNQLDSLAAANTDSSTMRGSRVPDSMVSPSNFNSMALDPRLAPGPSEFRAGQQVNTFPASLSDGQENCVETNLTTMNESLVPHAGISMSFTSPPQNVSVALDNPIQHQVLSPIHGATNTAPFARPHMSSRNHTQSLDFYHFNPAQTLFNPLHAGQTTQLPQPYLSSSSSSFRSPPPPMTNMPSISSFGLPFNAPVPQTGAGGRSDSVTSYASKNTPAESHVASQTQSSGFLDAPILSGVPAKMTIPVFNNGSYGPSPFDIPDTEFMGWLFENNPDWIYSPSPQTPVNQHSTGFRTEHHDYRPQDKNVHLEPFSSTASIPRTVLDSVQPESLLSGPRRQQLLDMIMNNFKDERHIQVTEGREKILQGDHDANSHVLSLRMMQVYISSFWLYIHGQLPILHRPTFSAETCPDLLLVAMMVLGASCLEKTHGYEVTQSCAELSFFLAWHARHLIFEDPDFLPPAKLWVFQALLLLEIFEKMYSTRSLHERAHVHHSTTLTLMRRGSSLVGRSALDFPPYDKDPTRTPPGPNGSINTAGRNTADEWWNYWISNEATRRTAFAAFIIDTTHANMFGHSAVMVVHEMRMPLPCDEELWSAKTGTEVRGLEQGYRPMGFLEALKKTLNSQNVQTNTFGRVIIMAGLLSVSWHMKMQDVRASSIGVGKQGSWGSQLRHAFDFWKRDFDASLAKSGNLFPHDRNHVDGLDNDNVFESRTVLHHLAHMAMHVDIVDCQILAGAKRILGRAITENDHAAASKRMKEIWAPSARARDAAFYALRFLSEVLFSEDNGHPGLNNDPLEFQYSAREDNLLNRPWVLYFATLVVWAYGYSLDGPIAPPKYTLTTHETKFRDMQIFLRRVGGVKTPEDLQSVRQRNGCLGLLMLLRGMFRTTRWELLHEASVMLGNCIELLMPGITIT